MRFLNWHFLANGRTLTRGALAGIAGWLLANPTALDFLPPEIAPILLAIAAALRSGTPDTPA